MGFFYFNNDSGISGSSANAKNDAVVAVAAITEPKNDAIDAKILIISLLSDYKLYGYCILSLKAYN